MKKLNNKGFLLVETLIVSVFVLTICVILYRNGMPIIQEYEKRENYDDIDSVYMVDTLRKYMMSQNISLSEVDIEGYKVIDCNSISTDICSSMNINENKVILAKWNLNNLVSAINGDIPGVENLGKGFKSYIRYVSNTVTAGDYSGKYRLLIERETSYINSDNKTIITYKYANIDY